VFVTLAAGGEFFVVEAFPGLERAIEDGFPDALTFRGGGDVWLMASSRALAYEHSAVSLSPRDCYCGVEDLGGYSPRRQASLPGSPGLSTKGKNRSNASADLSPAAVMRGTSGVPRLRCVTSQVARILRA
jgi:hypothetical protein